MSKSNRFIPILMYFLVAFGGIVVDIVVPSLPSIQKAFSSTEVLTQWAFAAAMVGFGVGQFFAGFIVDAYGRKKPMLLGGLFLAVSLYATTIVPSIQLVILLRLVQGLAVSLVCVGGRAVIKDLFHGEQYLKTVNWITISFAMGITLSPFAGAYILELFSWKMVFQALASVVLIGWILLLVCYQETHTNFHPINMTSIKGNLSEMFADSRFLRSSIICGVFYSILPAFNTVSPFLVQSQLGYSPVFYGYIALFLAACWLLGNAMNIILFKVSAESKTRVSLYASFIATLISVIYLLLNGLSLYVFIAPVAVIIFSLGMLFPLYLGKALAPFNHIAGIANATVFSGSWIATAAISFIASSLPSSSAEPLLVMYLVLIVFVLLIRV